MIALRDIARIAATRIEKHHHDRIGKLLICFAVCLKQHLQGDKINEELEPFLIKNQWADELSEIQAGRNRYCFPLSHFSKN